MTQGKEKLRGHMHICLVVSAPNKSLYMTEPIRKKLCGYGKPCMILSEDMENSVGSDNTRFMRLVFDGANANNKTLLKQENQGMVNSKQMKTHLITSLLLQ